MNRTIGSPAPTGGVSRSPIRSRGLRLRWADALGNGGRGCFFVASGECHQVRVDDAVGPAVIFRAEARSPRKTVLAFLPPDCDLAAGDASIPQCDIVDEFHSHPRSRRDAAFGTKIKHGEVEEDNGRKFELFFRIVAHRSLAPTGTGACAGPNAVYFVYASK